TDLVMTLLARWKSAAPAHSLELSVPGEVPGIIADAERLEQAIDRLIEHVIRCAAEGDSIRVTIRPVDGERLLSVRHFGRLLTLERFRQTFRPLLAAGGAEEYVSADMLGLVFVRAVALAHGGRLWAQLEEQDATLAVFLALPLVPPEVTPAGGLTSERATPLI